jgi:hypothetical protein
VRSLFPVQSSDLGGNVGMIVNLVLFFLFLAKVGVLCGFALSIPVLFFCDRIHAIGFEQVSERAVSRKGQLLGSSPALSEGNKPAPEVMARAA